MTIKGPLAVLSTPMPHQAGSCVAQLKTCNTWRSLITSQSRVDSWDLDIDQCCTPFMVRSIRALTGVACIKARQREAAGFVSRSGLHAEAQVAKHHLLLPTASAPRPCWVGRHNSDTRVGLPPQASCDCKKQEHIRISQVVTARSFKI
jgi:hypothetical protein